MTARARARMVAGFDAFARRPPSRVRQTVMVILAVALPMALWNKHGAAVGVLAFAVYGSLFLSGAFDHRAALRWSRRRVAMDAALIVPLTFLGLAYVTDLALAACLAIAAGAGAVFVPLALRRHGRR